MIFTFLPLKIVGCGMSLYRIAFQGHERCWISRVLDRTRHEVNENSVVTIALLGATRGWSTWELKATAIHMPSKEFLRPPTFFVLSDNVNRMKHFSFLFFSGTTRTNTHFPSHMFLRLPACERLRITNKLFLLKQRTNKILIFSIIFCLHTSFTRITFSHFSGFVWWRRINRITGVDIAVGPQGRSNSVVKKKDFEKTRRRNKKTKFDRKYLQFHQIVLVCTEFSSIFSGNKFASL